MTDRLELVPDQRFPAVARRIIEFAHESLDSGSLFASNIALTEQRADTFATLLAQYEQLGSISLSDKDAVAVLEAYGLTEHILSDHLGPDVLAQRFGHDTASIAAMRSELEVLKPIVGAIGGASVAAGSPESVAIANSPDRRVMNDADVFRQRVSFATETLPADQVEYWAEKYEIDPEVVRDAYAEIRSGMRNTPAPARADVVAIEQAPRRGMRR